MKLRYASVCSGVEAATLAWHRLGWEPAWFSEIDPFPCAVLKERFPTIPNLGDMTKIKCLDSKKGVFQYGDQNADGTFPELVCGRIDLLVGGTPCQSFSQAGTRTGLRGVSGLALTYCDLLAAMRPKWIVWENVPGVFSTNGGEDFRTFVRTIDALGYCCAWRVLDTQHVRTHAYPLAIPQRRRRVFLVGHSGADWRYPAEVLFERESLFGNPPPRRIKGKGFAAGTEGGVGDAGKGAVGSRDIYCRAGDDGRAETMRECCPTQRRTQGAIPIVGSAATITDRAGKPGGGKGPLVSVERSLTLNTGNTQNLVQTETRGCETFNGTVAGDVSTTVTAACAGANHSGAKVLSVHGAQDPIISKEVGHPLGAINNGLENTVFSVDSAKSNSMKSANPNSGFHRAEVARTLDTTTPEPTKAQGGQMVVSRAHVLSDQGGQRMDADEELAQTLRAETHNHAPIVAIGFDAYQQQATGDIAQTLKASRADNEHMPSVCYPIEGNGTRPSHRGDGYAGADAPGFTLNTAEIHGVATRSSVRRITPTEAERLMGFPDNWTRIPWRGKPEEECPDGPRYKCCGNSMSVNCMEWIGEGINEVERLIREGTGEERRKAEEKKARIAASVRKWVEEHQTEADEEEENEE